MQSEYSLWTRNPELGILKACKDVGAAFVAFSPMGRKFLSGELTDMSALPEWDLRHTMPRFNEQNFGPNLSLLKEFLLLAKSTGIAPAELAIA